MSSTSPPKRRRSESRDRDQPPSKRHVKTSISETSRLSSGPSSAFAGKTIASLPTELLDYIFELVLPPEYLLRPRRCTFVHGSSAVNVSNAAKVYTENTAWHESMLSKKGLVSVCRDWYLRGTSHLYRNIIIKDLHTLDLLSRTLTAQPHLGGFVRTITFTIRVELFWDEVYEDLARIFTLCPKLVRVNDLPPKFDPGEKGFPWENVEEDLAPPFPALPPSVTALAIGPYRNPPSSAYDMLKDSCRWLEELHIHLDNTAAFPPLPLSFPHLHTLHLTCTGHNDPKTSLAHWDMPALRNLTFRLSQLRVRVNTLQHAVFPEYQRILKLHGESLEYVAFPAPSMFSSDDLALCDYGPLLALCPAAARVVLPVQHRISADSAMPGTVRFLDLWSECRGPWLVEGNDLDIKTHFPAAKVRLLDCVFENIVHELPRAVDPASCAPGEWILGYPCFALYQREQHGVAHLMYRGSDGGTTVPGVLVVNGTPFLP
ncbi:hypothetical protein DFH09DRAFT_1355819 [Mycena vulgaris]|nr:hypothetical protein DFH09DRAFT_1355819 [Mycena vulgaris]